MSDDSTMSRSDHMWHPVSILVRVAVALPAFVVLATGIYLLTVLPERINADDMWQQHSGWPDPVPPAWPYWVVTLVALVGLIGSLVWNDRSILRGTPVVGIALAFGAFVTSVFGTRFPGVEAWPHSLLWCGIALAIFSVVAFVASAVVNRSATNGFAAAK